MAYTPYKKKKNVYLSPSDIARIKAINENPHAIHRKMKFAVTYKHPKLKDEIVKIIYGQDLEEVKTHIKEDLEFFKKSDKSWKVIKTENLKSSDEKQSD